MNRISKHNQEAERVRFGDLRTTSLLFVDDVVLYASSCSDLQLALEQFTVVGIRISTSTSENMLLS